MEDVYNQLNRYLRGSSRFGTNEGIARFLLTHLNEIPTMRLANVAERCYVSTPSVIRFCRELGYSDFTAFKAAARSYVNDIRNDSIGDCPDSIGDCPQLNHCKTLFFEQAFLWQPLTY